MPLLLVILSHAIVMFAVMLYVIQSNYFYSGWLTPVNISEMVSNGFQDVL